MTATVLDGKTLAAEIEAILAKRIAHSKSKHPNFAPTLATILVGDDPASATYVQMKGRACERIGMKSIQLHLPQNTNTEQLVAEIDQLNHNPAIHGILLQHPVPKQINERACFDHIALNKDVDGVTTAGFGKMAMGEPAYGSATPMGIMTLLSHYQISLRGKHAVVIGRSPILGRPLAMMLLQADATVTICHSHTHNLAALTKQADIVVGAVGKPKFIQADWLKPGAVVIDAGYHPGGIGDVDLSNAIPQCSAYTPVPGGVGPMTIVSLMQQTLHAAELSSNIV